jgi:drug/metabolite transporter (DMT)-like permease
MTIQLNSAPISGHSVVAPRDFNSDLDSIQNLPNPLPQQPMSFQSGDRFKVVAAVALVAALLCISVSALLVRFSEQELSPYAISFNRFWVTVVLMSFWCGFQALRRRWSSATLEAATDSNSHSVSSSQHITVSCTHACEPINHSILHLTETKPENANESTVWNWIGWQLLAVSGFLAADLMLWSWSLTRTSVANATLLSNLTPLFTCLGGWIFWQKSFQKKLLLGMAIAVGGMGLIGLNDLQVGAVKLQGDAIALLAAISFSIYLLMLERLQNRLSTTRIVFWCSAIAALLTFPIVAFTHGPWFPTSWQGWSSIVSLAFFCQILGQALLVFSLNHLPAEFVAIFLLFDPILAALGGWICFSETLNGLTLFAFAVVSLGIYLASQGHGTAKAEDAESTSTVNFSGAHNAGA